MLSVYTTYDRFTAIMHTSEGQANGRLVPGHALVMETEKPFRGLASFGNNFLSKFEGAEVGLLLQYLFEDTCLILFL